MTKVKEFITEQLQGLDRGFVATPATRENLESFARSNGGSMDIVLMQMAIQYGYKIALENLSQLVGKE